MCCPFNNAKQVWINAWGLNEYSNFLTIFWKEKWVKKLIICPMKKSFTLIKYFFLSNIVEENCFNSINKFPNKWWGWRRWYLELVHVLDKGRFLYMHVSLNTKIIETDGWLPTFRIKFLQRSWSHDYQKFCKTFLLILLLPCT